MSAAWDELRASLRGKDLGVGAFGVVRRGRRFGLARFTLAGQPYLSIETTLGEPGALDEGALVRGLGLPIGRVQLRDGRFQLCQAVPMSAATAQELEVVIEAMAQIARDLAPPRPPPASCHAFDHYAT